MSQINSSNELVLTELILDNILADYTAEEVVALLSVFIFVEKTESAPEIPEKVQQVCRPVQVSNGLTKHLLRRVWTSFTVLRNASRQSKMHTR